MKLQVTEFSFWEFCQKVQEAIIAGYRFSDSNECMPSAYVGNYNCIMVKDITEDVKVVKEALEQTMQLAPKSTVTEAIKPQESKKGRPAKTQ